MEKIEMGGVVFRCIFTGMREQRAEVGLLRYGLDQEVSSLSL